MCNADAIQFIFYNMLSRFHFVLHYLLVSYSSADLTTVEVLQPANLSHPSLVFGTCADVYPSIKDVRQENVVDLMLRQHRQPICLLFHHFFVRLPRLHKETIGETAGTTILSFHFGAWNVHLGVVEAPKWFANMHSGEVQHNLSLFGDRMCDSLLIMASHFHKTKPRSPRAIGSVFGQCLPTLLMWYWYCHLITSNVMSNASKTPILLKARPGEAPHWSPMSTLHELRRNHFCQARMHFERFEILGWEKTVQFRDWDLVSMVHPSVFCTQ